MRTRLLLPKIDEKIADFVNTQPNNVDYVPTLDPCYIVSILYFGHIYRHIICYDRQELLRLENFLDSTGYLKKIEPRKGFYRSWELIE